ncbi:MAG: alpha/beta hydrolase [Alphaproteobacteria bacterium]|nr:alpha/beta hydrolase [Alphaproteobacteria bacterium]
MFREHTFSAQDGLTLYYRDYGDSAAQRTPLMCLPGLTRNSKDFHALALRHAMSRRVVCPDYRGRGRSGYDPDYRNYRAETHLSDLLHLLTVAGLAHVVVIGTSAGGLLAMGLALARPSALTAVVLNDIGPGIAAGGRARILEYVGRPVQPADWVAAAAWCRAQWEAAHRDFTDDDWMNVAHQTFVDDGGRLRLDYDLALARALKRSGPPRDTWNWFAALRNIPVLAICGADSDVLSADTFERMVALKPDLRRVTVPGRGHAPDLSEPACVEALDDFLSRL